MAVKITEGSDRPIPSNSSKVRFENISCVEAYLVYVPDIYTGVRELFFLLRRKSVMH